MDRDKLLDVMRTRAGWSSDELAAEVGLDSGNIAGQLEVLLQAGEVRLSPLGRWRVDGAAKSPLSSTTTTTGEWGHRTRMLIYSPEIIAACPQFTRNTFLHFVEDEDHGFRLRDYADGRRVEAKEVTGITTSRELAEAYPRYELEFDDDEDVTPLTDNPFWEKRIAAHNEANRAMLERGAVAAGRVKSSGVEPEREPEDRQIPGQRPE